MISSLFASLATLIYSGLAYRHWQFVARQHHAQNWCHPAALAAMLLQGAALISSFALPNGYDLGLATMTSLVFWFIALLATVAARSMPIQSLLIPVYSLAALASLLLASHSTNATHSQHVDWGILSHIVISLLAYAVLIIAAIHAVILASQEQHLKRRQTHGLIQVLPPLQTMELLLFRMLSVGVALLTGAIVSGALFLDDIFAQHLVHKTVLTIVAWAIFSILLLGHYQWGWRGPKAIRWVLAGFSLLMLAYFGSKLVLEVILR